jgi:hypothetical protein
LNTWQWTSALGCTVTGGRHSKWRQPSEATSALVPARKLRRLIPKCGWPISLILRLWVAFTGCAPAPSAPPEGDGFTTAQLTIERLEAVALESDPIQVEVFVTGVFPAGCARPRFALRSDPDARRILVVPTFVSAPCADRERRFREILRVEAEDWSPGTYGVEAGPLRREFFLDTGHPPSASDG